MVVKVNYKERLIRSKQNIMIYQNHITGKNYICLQMRAIDESTEYIRIKFYDADNLDSIVYDNNGMKIYFYKKIGCSMYLDINSERRVCRHFLVSPFGSYFDNLEWEYRSVPLMTYFNDVTLRWL